MKEKKSPIRFTSDKTIEIDIKVLKKIIDKNDIHGYQRLANILLFEVITVADYEYFKWNKDYEKERSKQS
jgi:hypothetical protein